MNLKTEKLPSGMTISSIGARPEVCLNRPWQLPLADHINPDKCPFENNKLGEKAEKFGNWRVIDKDGGADYHKLLMPNKCWPAEKLQKLGGATEIKKALDIGSELITRDGQEKVILIAQVGWGGGQSLGHPHWHLRTLERTGGTIALVVKFLSKLDRSQLIVGGCGGWKAVLNGQHAGQCFILSSGAVSLGNETRVKELSVLVNHIISLYNVKFKSAEGMPPDFSVSFLITKGSIYYGCYIPTLYHEGAYNKLEAIERCVVQLPWTHEVTLRHLLADD